MRLTIVRSDDPHDGRVAATPATITSLTERGIAVEIEAGAGEAAGHPDDAYRDVGASIVDGTSALANAEVVASVLAPSAERLATIAEGAVLIGLLRPVHATEVARILAARRITAFAMELVPRISRAQSMDALSSQAGIAGYKAVLLAANELDKLFPLSMTAAGTIKPASVVVLGAGVAGLQAVATAKRLGASVKANDVRAAAADEVSSLGADFIHIPGVTDQDDASGYARKLGAELAAAQHEALLPHLAQADAVICTAQIPGRRAPTLLTTAMVEQMRPGSVVIDLPAEDGGNCELTDPTRTVEHNGVRIVPAPQLARTLPSEASHLYARNVANLLGLLVTDDAALHVDDTDEVVIGSLLTRDGEIVHGPTAEAVAAASDQT